MARGARRPRDAGLGVREAGGRRRDDPPGFLLESVEHAERWGRFSFLGRDPGAHAGGARVARSSSTGRRRRACPPMPGALAALEALLARYRAPHDRRAAAVPRRRRRATSATTSSARSSGCPTSRPTTSACPTRCCRSPGTSPRSTTSASGSTSSRTCSSPDGADDAAASDAYDAAVRTARRAGRRAGAPAAVRAVAAARGRPRPSCPPSRRRCPRRLYHARGRGGARVHPRRRHLPGRARAALRPRRPLDPFDVYRVLRQVNPSPYMYFVRHPEVTLVGSSPEPMVQLLDGRVISRPIAGTRCRGRTESTTGAWPPSWSRTRRSGPST